MPSSTVALRRIACCSRCSSRSCPHMHPVPVGRARVDALAQMPPLTVILGRRIGRGDSRWCRPAALPWSLRRVRERLEQGVEHGTGDSGGGGAFAHARARELAQNAKTAARFAPRGARLAVVRPARAGAWGRRFAAVAGFAPGPASWIGNRAGRRAGQCGVEAVVLARERLKITRALADLLVDPVRSSSAIAPLRQTPGGA